MTYVTENATIKPSFDDYTYVTCPKCAGHARWVTPRGYEYCPACRGKGRVLTKARPTVYTTSVQIIEPPKRWQQVGTIISA